MHRFKYRGNYLYAEDIKVSSLLEKFGTPLYIYSANTFLDHFLKLKSAFKELSPLICFSVKSNSNLAVLRLLSKAGAGMDVVSGGELFRALKAGSSASKVVYAGVGKREDEIIYAIKKGIKFFNVESISELERINKAAKSLGKKQGVCLRLNPDVDPKTHKFITTGKKETKFGLSYGVIKNILQNRNNYKNLLISGLHLHIGSQIIYNEPFLKAIKVALKLKSEKYCDFQYLNIGGGLGIIYKDEKALTAQKYASEIKGLIKKAGLKLILEPGRFIAGNSGILVTTVQYIKDGIDKKFAIVDGGMNLLIRPALYSAYHEAGLAEKRAGRKELYDVVGPICESSDFLALSRSFPKLKSKDKIVLFSAGAYGFTMASNYNSHPRCGEVMVKDSSSYLIKDPEGYKDLIRGESMPGFLK
ncbi:MAG: diaminopimelate decarboxylase [Candidatus Kaelpia aquatica]|nr:diaminopimelate decarboxylase [Candidatus Kaelpia aquatica]